jgi:subfamily B ATP-binding cassette protein MsbA
VTEPPKRPRFKNAWAEARQIIGRHRYRLAIGLLLMLVNRAAAMVLPASTKFVIDEIIGHRRSDLLWLVALAAGGATLIQSATSFAMSQVLGVAAQKAITDMRRTVQEHVMRLPVSYFDSTKTGVLISRIMSDAEGIRNLVGTGIVQLVGGFLTGIIAVGVLLWLNWQLTAITFVVLLCFGGGLAFALTRLRPLLRDRGKLNADVTGRLAESLGGIRIVKAYVAERREDLVFTRGVHQLFRNVAKSVTAVSALSAFAAVIVGTIGVLIIVIGGRAVLAGTMTVGDLFMYGVFTGLMAAPMIQIASIGTQITEAFAGLDRIREIRLMATEDEDLRRRTPLADLQGDVSFEEVSFEYRPNTPVLKHVTFCAPAGSTTALVGSSGAGKSTLISLIMTFNQPLSGRILVDGHNLAVTRLRDYRAHLGVVLQDNFLFDGTIAENIRFGRPQASLEEVQAVARIAHCDAFVAGFEQGYDTIVGERGIKLSGGQRQRIAIARAILANPRILILDEATSSLDSESEAQIQDGLRALRRGRTTFVIAHRLSTIVSADQILVLEGGEIVERGTHAALLALDGRYRQLYDRQYQIERDRFINPGEDFTPEPASATPVTSRTPPTAL